MSKMLACSRTVFHRVSCIVALVCTILPMCSRDAVGQAESSGITGAWCCQDVCEELLGLYREQAGGNGLTFRVADNDQVSAELASGSCWIGVHRGPWGVPDLHRFEKSLDGIRKPDAFLLGTYVVQVIVSAKNPIRAMSIEELSGIYRGKVLKWDGVRGGMRGKSIHIFSPAFTDTEMLPV